MPPRVASGLIGLALLWPAGPTWALDYRSIAEPAVMYDAPSKQAQRRFVVAAATPVEVVVAIEGWVKVRDAAGDITWVERRVIADRRTVIVTAAKAEVRREASPDAPIVFEAAQEVVLEWQEGAPLGWAKVRHRDGQSGFVRVNQVWGG